MRSVFLLPLFSQFCVSLYEPLPTLLLVGDIRVCELIRNSSFSGNFLRMHSFLQRKTLAKPLDFLGQESLIFRVHVTHECNCFEGSHMRSQRSRKSNVFSLFVCPLQGYPLFLSWSYPGAVPPVMSWGTLYRGPGATRTGQGILFPGLWIPAPPRQDQDRTKS